MRTSLAAPRRTWPRCWPPIRAEAANACLQFHGGIGFACEYDVERKFRKTRLYQVAPISTNLILDLAALAQAGATMILPLIESALGLWNAAAIARASRVQRLVFGAIDFSFDAGITEGHEQLLHARSQLVLVSRVAGIQAPVDGVTTTLDDLDSVRSDAMRARALGFGGKLCIHPKQVPVTNQAFAPSEAELAWASGVVAAASASQGAAVALDGKMIDRPVILVAQQMLDEAAARRSR
jgi:citrate lyase subunit beta/citryl-CoA lyase